MKKHIKQNLWGEKEIDHTPDTRRRDPNGKLQCNGCAMQRVKEATARSRNLQRMLHETWSKNASKMLQQHKRIQDAQKEIEQAQAFDISPTWTLIKKKRSRGIGSSIDRAMNKPLCRHLGQTSAFARDIGTPRTGAARDEEYDVAKEQLLKPVKRKKEWPFSTSKLYLQGPPPTARPNTCSRTTRGQARYTWNSTALGDTESPNSVGYSLHEKLLENPMARGAADGYDSANWMAEYDKKDVPSMAQWQEQVTKHLSHHREELKKQTLRAAAGSKRRPISAKSSGVEIQTARF